MRNWGNSCQTKWSGFNPEEPSSKEKYKLLHLGRKNLKAQTRLGADWQSSSAAETELTVDAQLNTSQQGTLVTNTTKMQTEQYRLAGSGQRIEGMFCSPLLSTGEAIFGIQSSFGTTRTKGMGRNWNWPTGGCVT